MTHQCISHPLSVEDSARHNGPRDAPIRHRPQQETDLDDLTTLIRPDRNSIHIHDRKTLASAGQVILSQPRSPDVHDVSH